MEAQKDKEWIARKNKRNCIISDYQPKLELRLGLPNHESKPKYLNLPFSSERIVQQAFLTQWPCESAPSCSLKRLHKSKPREKQIPVDEVHLKALSFANDKEHHKSSPSSIVGWPPLRSSRKCVINSIDFTKTTPKSSKEAMQKDSEGKSDEGSKYHMFVKINMEGVPIGRKIDLKAYDNYQELSYAIDGLFRDLLAAQTKYSSTENDNKRCNAKAVSESLYENEEYTLVYEDSEGDRILVGDVPWQMFVTTAKRLRVLRCSEVSTMQGSSCVNDKTLLDHMETAR